MRGISHCSTKLPGFPAGIFNRQSSYMQSDVKTESVLHFISINAEPLNFLDFPDLKFWSSGSRCSKAMIDKAFELAADCGCPIKNIDGKLYVNFFNELKLISEWELQIFLNDCFNAFGLPCFEYPTILSS